MNWTRFLAAGGRGVAGDAEDGARDAEDPEDPEEDSDDDERDGRDAVELRYCGVSSKAGSPPKQSLLPAAANWNLPTAAAEGLFFLSGIRGVACLVSAHYLMAIYGSPSAICRSGPPYRATTSWTRFLVVGFRGIGIGG